MRRWAVIGAITAFLGVGAFAPRAPQAQQTLRVYAAASLHVVLEDAVRLFESDARIVIVPGASLRLVRQILEGAPADLFIGAHPEALDRLARAGLLAAETRRVFAQNRLLLAAPATAPFTRTHAPDAGLDAAGIIKEALGERLVLADPDIAPAGIYAREALMHFALWEAVRQQSVYARSARGALFFLLRGEVGAGFIYESDYTTHAQRLHLIARIPETAHTPIRYESALIKNDARPSAELRAFYDFLASAPVRAGLTRDGFLLPRASDTP